MSSSFWSRPPRLPLITGWIHELGDTCDMAFFAACWLIPYYVLTGFVRLVVSPANTSPEPLRGHGDRGLVALACTDRVIGQSQEIDESAAAASA